VRVAAPDLDELARETAVEEQVRSPIRLGVGLVPDGALDEIAREGTQVAGVESSANVVAGEATEIARGREHERLEPAVRGTAVLDPDALHAFELLRRERLFEHFHHLVQALHHHEIVRDGIEKQRVQELADQEQGAQMPALGLVVVFLSVDLARRARVPHRNDDELFRAGTDRRRDRCVEAQATVAVVVLADASCGEQQRNRRGCQDVLRRDLLDARDAPLVAGGLDRDARRMLGEDRRAPRDHLESRDD
jgi:hypothetical protein